MEDGAGLEDELHQQDATRADSFNYIERFCNPSQCRSTLKYFSPIRFEAAHAVVVRQTEVSGGSGAAQSCMLAAAMGSSGQGQTVVCILLDTDLGRFAFQRTSNFVP